MSFAKSGGMMLNNLWGTNYVMWHPYKLDSQAVAGMENIRSRYAQF